MVNQFLPLINFRLRMPVYPRRSIFLWEWSFTRKFCSYR